MPGPLVQPLWELKHYYAFTEPRPKPTGGELRRAANNIHGPTGAQHVVFAIMASCELSHRLRLADETWCSPHHGKVRCHAYVDCEEFPSGAFRPANALRMLQLSSIGRFDHARSCGLLWLMGGARTFPSLTMSWTVAHARS